MLCNTCRTECSVTMPGSGEHLHVLYYYCNVCDMYKITFKHGNEKNSILGTLRVINSIRKALDGSGWRMDSIKQSDNSGDDQWL